MFDSINKYFEPEFVRLQNWDYGWNGAYFVTIKTKENIPYFGQIRSFRVELSDIGKLAEKYWMEIPFHFAFVELDAFIVMPDHIHGILKIKKPITESSRQCLEPTTDSKIVASRHCLEVNNGNELNQGQKRCRNQGKHTLSSIIGSFKSIVSRKAHEMELEFAWQRRFYDHVIKGEYIDELRKYILLNPLHH